MKLTVLQMTQKILSDLESDEVNSIADTVEALQVAEILEDVYFQMITTQDIPELRSLLKIVGLSDPSKPNYMILPTSVDRLDVLKYNTIRDGETDPQFVNIPFMAPEDFLERVVGRNLGATNIIEVEDTSGVKILIRNDQAPRMWTSFDDEHIVFDAYDSAVETTLQENKTMAYGVKRPTFTKSDDFIPDMDANLFPYYLAEAKSTASIIIKQSVNSKLEQQARKQRLAQHSQKNRFNTTNYTGPNYGR